MLIKISVKVAHKIPAHKMHTSNSVGGHVRPEIRMRVDRASHLVTRVLCLSADSGLGFRPVGPAKDFRKFDSKFWQNLRSWAKFAPTSLTSSSDIMPQSPTRPWWVMVLDDSKQNRYQFNEV